MGMAPGYDVLLGRLHAERGFGGWVDVLPVGPVPAWLWRRLAHPPHVCDGINVHRGPDTVTTCARRACAATGTMTATPIGRLIAIHT